MGWSWLSQPNLRSPAQRRMVIAGKVIVCLVLAHLLLTVAFGGFKRTQCSYARLWGVLWLDFENDPCRSIYKARAVPGRRA